MTISFARKYIEEVRPNYIYCKKKLIENNHSIEDYYNAVSWFSTSLDELIQLQKIDTKIQQFIDSGIKYDIISAALHPDRLKNISTNYNIKFYDLLMIYS